MQNNSPRGVLSLSRDDPSTFAPPPAFGPFRVLHQVGVGALGPVFRTYEPTRDRLVAVKVFRLDITPEQSQALVDELTVATEAGLFHPSIVEPIAAGIEGTVAYRAEEYVAAESLDVAMRHYAPAPIDKVLPFITQLAGAIDFARTAGVGHGALHPRDIFVTPDEARATGFGVVEAMERVGLRAPVRRPYSAPERVGGAAWNTAADVFSLAAITYELLTGRRPAGPGAQVGEAAEPGLGKAGEALYAVLARAMDEDPSRRYPSALEFASALDAASRGVGPSGSIERTTPARVAAAPIASADEPDPDDTIAAMPVPGQIDEHAEPVRAEQFERPPAMEESVEEPAAVEQHRVLRQSDETSDQPINDLDFEDRSEQTDRFAEEFAGFAAEEERPVPTRTERDPSSAPSAAYVPPAPLEDYADQSRSLEGGGVSRSVFGIVVILALLVGYAAGYMTPKAGDGGDVTRETAQQEAPAAAERPVAETSGTGTPRPYSEQAVTPPSPVTEAPPAAGEPVAPAPAAAPVRGRIVVRSSPSRAGVTVDGRWRGRTPLTLDDVQLGTHEVRVVQPGFVVASESVSLSSASPSRTLSFRLQRTQPASRPQASPPTQPTQTFFGSIYVDSRPRGARVLLDGKMMGTTPVRIPEVRVGSHVVRLQLEDHRDWTTSTRVSSGQEARVTGSLDRIR